MVIVIAGKDKGRQGKVEKVYQKVEKVLIAEINLYKRHIKKNEKMPQGGIISLPRPLSVAKVMLICPMCKKPTRVGNRNEKNKKFRVCKKCQNKFL